MFHFKATEKKILYFLLKKQLKEKYALIYSNNVMRPLSYNDGNFFSNIILQQYFKNKNYKYLFLKLNNFLLYEIFYEELLKNNFSYLFFKINNLFFLRNKFFLIFYKKKLLTLFKFFITKILKIYYIIKTYKFIKS